MGKTLGDKKINPTGTDPEDIGAAITNFIELHGRIEMHLNLIALALYRECEKNKTMTVNDLQAIYGDPLDLTQPFDYEGEPEGGGGVKSVG